MPVSAANAMHTLKRLMFIKECVCVCMHACMCAFVYMCVRTQASACVSVTCVRRPTWAEEDIRSAGARLIGSCKPLTVGAEN